MKTNPNLIVVSLFPYCPFHCPACRMVSDRIDKIVKFCDNICSLEAKLLQSYQILVTLWKNIELT